MAGDMLSTSEVAEYLGIHEKHVYRLLRAGRLPGTRITGHWVFSRRLVREWIEANSRQAVAHKPSKAKAAVEPHHLIICGSDDILLQVVLREFNRRHPSMLATSATVGSLAGLRAVHEGRAHVAGVRVLVDHLLSGHKLGKRGLPGYETELFTHLEVATAVAEGRADVGVGTLGPARSLGLDFVHLTWERYDLLTTEQSFYRRPTQALFEMIKSDWLRQLIARVPGYDARETGLFSVVEPDTSVM